MEELDLIQIFIQHTENRWIWNQYLAFLSCSVHCKVLTNEHDTMHECINVILSYPQCRSYIYHWEARTKISDKKKNCHWSLKRVANINTPTLSLGKQVQSRQRENSGDEVSRKKSPFEQKIILFCFFCTFQFNMKLVFFGSI